MHALALPQSQRSARWVVDLTGYTPLREGHWPAYVAGFTLSKSGRIWLCDNKPIIIDEQRRAGVLAPCHRDLVNGSGDDKTQYSGLYCFNPKDRETTLWLYPDAESNLNQQMMLALTSLIGVHNILSSTVVFSNTSRKALFSLGNV
jgi:hypothetical protein